MKFRFSLITICTILCFFSCQKNDDDNNSQENPNIPNIVFDTGALINTNLPQYNSMQFAGNYITLNSNYGVNGVVVYYAGGTNYSAFELTDPAHQLNTCSNLTVDGITATCSCTDANKFNIITGTAVEGTSSNYPLTRYFVEVSGNIIRVFNN